MRRVNSKQRITRPDGRSEDMWPISNDEEFLWVIFTDLFNNHYERISSGPLLGGAAYELTAPRKPKRITHSDGYLTIHWGDKGHLDLCIGQIRVPAGRPDADESLLNDGQAVWSSFASSIAMDIRTVGFENVQREKQLPDSGVFPESLCHGFRRGNEKTKDRI